MKNTIKWNSSYIIGINQIDSQHRMLFAIAEKILAVKKPSEHKEEIAELLKALLTNLTVHFNTEESLFVKFKYPFKELHLQRHQIMQDEIVGMIKNNNSLDLFINIFNDFLHRWLVEHIMEDDMNFAKWASSKEVQKNSSTVFF